MDTPDQIERVITIPAKPEQVWRAIATPQGLNGWFAGKIEGDFHVGSDIVFVFGEDNIKPVRIVNMEPTTRFAYRWRPYTNDLAVNLDALPSTLVEFRLEPTPEGTKLTVTESGFSQIPADVRAKSFADNSGGWTEELQGLAAYVVAQADPMHATGAAQ